ncbi:hypothetical protein K4A83_20070 [Spirulina subsalsa FACHB-351]|uniref:Uncharacterized protein n=1 Tax=Spirulina subsalsa FACHB-351 TaxID=234711 RepID=A0ABT3LAN7_9CYAN|nr:hypothetical protein [Spirulina subsalsa]MCW6038553.1 hypothetical protein [Spirulina subsalsa FACHB-351]
MAAMPDKAWDSFFYNADSKLPKLIKISGINSDNTCKSTTLKVSDVLSPEMIRAFAELGNDRDYQDQGTYFELTRDPRNNQIVSIQRDFELLQYDLKHNQPIRGEI